MKNFINYLLIALIAIPFISFSQDDEEVNAAEVFMDGTIGLDDQGLYLETADCLYPGKWRLGGVADENTGDKKADKAAKKQNKKVAKTNKKLTKQVTKAGGSMENMQVKGTFGTKEGFFSPIKKWKPLSEPVLFSSVAAIASYKVLNLDMLTSLETLGAGVLADIYATWVWDMYQRTQAQKEACRKLDWKGEDPVSSIESGLQLYSYDVENKQCKEVGMDEVMAMDSVLRQSIKNANKMVLEGIAGGALGVALGAMAIDKAKEDPLGNAAIIIQVGIQIANQTRIMGDLNRLKKHLKQSGEVLDAINNL